MKKPMIFVASVKPFNQGKADKNGLLPVLLSPISGTSPRGINVISGSSAELYNLEVGNVYGIKAIELEPGDNGFNEDVPNRQFQYSNEFAIPVELAIKYAMEGDVTILISNAEQDTWAKAKGKAKDKEEVKEEV